MEGIRTGHHSFPITVRDIAGGIIALLENGALTEMHLLRYFEDNETLLRQNISQAKAIYQQDQIGSIIKENYPQYLNARERIVTNYKSFAVVRDQVIEKITGVYADRMPGVVLVPCIGLFSAGGWADNINGTYHIFVALERLSEDFAVDILLTHEIAHGISEIHQDTILGGFYNEGYATYVSSVLYPGHNEEIYFYNMNQAQYARYLDWIDNNREKINADSGEDFVVLDDLHKFYFTTSFSDYPNIGYVIGFKYLAYLQRSHTLSELRTFGLNDAVNRAALTEFILYAPIK